MRHKKPIFLFFVSMIIVGIVTIPILYNAYISSRIYYIIDYNINLPNREEIIDKVETFNYSACLYYSSTYLYEQPFVDRVLIVSMKNSIENDPGYWYWSHYLRYYFFGENCSKLYLTYDDNTILSLKDQNNHPLLLGDYIGDYYYTTDYLNFSQIPYIPDGISTFELNESIFVEINLEYRWGMGSYSRYQQYLVLNMNLDIILIYIYYDIFID
ncbi:MAG: hypothetical protein ACFFA7_01005 [Promethearchaeota archaeon]